MENTKPSPLELQEVLGYSEATFCSGMDDASSPKDHIRRKGFLQMYLGKDLKVDQIGLGGP